MSEPRVNIADEFPNVVKSCHGEIVEDLLNTKSPDFDNADYLFREYGVVAELKCLTKSNVADPNFTAKLAKVYRKLLDQDRAPIPFGRVRVSLEQIAKIDRRAADEFLEPYKQNLGRVLKKANSQIKDTAKYFGIEQPAGLLLLANDGDLGMDFDLLVHLLNRLLMGCYRSINTILYFTANVTVDVPNFQPSFVWVRLEIPERPMVNATLLKRLCDGWMNHFADLKGVPVFAVAPASTVDPAQCKLTGRMTPKIDLR